MRVIPDRVPAVPGPVEVLVEGWRVPNEKIAVVSCPGASIGNLRLNDLTVCEEGWVELTVADGRFATPPTVTVDNAAIAAGEVWIAAYDIFEPHGAVELGVGD